MRKRQVLIGLGTAAAITLAACGGGGNEAESSASPSIETTTIEESTQDPSPTPTTSEESSTTAGNTIMGVPYFEHLEYCDALRCSLPVNPTTKLVDGYAITDDNWPLEPSSVDADDGDTITVVCYLEGDDWVQDDRGATFNTDFWYKVIIPKEKLAIVDDFNRGLTTDDLETTPDGDYYGYVSILWLLILENADVPAC